MLLALVTNDNDNDDTQDVRYHLYSFNKLTNSTTTEYLYIYKNMCVECRPCTLYTVQLLNQHHFMYGRNYMANMLNIQYLHASGEFFGLMLNC